MPSAATIAPGRLCHWGYIDPPRHSGATTRIRVWICEHPYRTIRRDGPDPDCEGCREGERLATYGLRVKAGRSTLTT